MTNEPSPPLRLPALDGRTPLGFLAAVGILRLLTEHHNIPAKLAWSTVDCTAELTGSRGGIDELVADLHAVVDTIPPGGVLPDLPANLPPLGEAPDKMRLPREQLAHLAQKVRAEGGDPAERWMASLVTDLSLDDKARADISLYTAPSGKQSMRTMLEKPLRYVREHPDVLREAVVSWRRYPDVTGEYLDHRVLYDAADAPDGKSRERGVPGATWLALMAYPLFRTTAVHGKPSTTGWHYRTSREQDRRLSYPLWTHPMDLCAARALLDHPLVAAAPLGRATERLTVLSIFMVCGANRRRVPGRNFAGVLTPLPPDLPDRQRAVRPSATGSRR